MKTLKTISKIAGVASSILLVLSLLIIAIFQYNELSALHQLIVCVSLLLGVVLGVIWMILFDVAYES